MDTGRCSETGGKSVACFSRCKLRRSKYWCRSPPRRSTEPGRDSLLSVRYVCLRLSCESKTPVCMHADLMPAAPRPRPPAQVSGGEIRTPVRSRCRGRRWHAPPAEKDDATGAVCSQAPKGRWGAHCFAGDVVGVLRPRRGGGAAGQQARRPEQHLRGTLGSAL